MLNVFDNVKNVEFHEKDYDRILAIISSEGETVQVRPVACSVAVKLVYSLCDYRGVKYSN